MNMLLWLSLANAEEINSPEIPPIVSVDGSDTSNPDSSGTDDSEKSDDSKDSESKETSTNSAQKNDPQNGNGQKKANTAKKTNTAKKNGQKANGPKKGSGQKKPISGQGSVKKLPTENVTPPADTEGTPTDVDTESDAANTFWTETMGARHKSGLILRPQVGVTNLGIGNESFSGYHAGLHLGTRKSTEIQLLSAGVYHRSRILILPTVGKVNGLDARMGGVVGLKVTGLEVETGVDFLRHSLNSPEGYMNFDPAYGVAVPVKALFVSKMIKVKAGVEPRWYVTEGRTPVDWTTHSATEKFPIPLIGDEFSWNVGLRIGLMGMSYNQLYMNGGTERVISLGLQR